LKIKLPLFWKERRRMIREIFGAGLLYPSENVGS
jgi:hypothetical protein